MLVFFAKTGKKRPTAHIAGYADSGTWSFTRLFGSEAGEVLLVDSRGRSTTSTATRAIASELPTSTSSTTTSLGSVLTATGRLNEAHVDVKVGLLLALSLTLSLLLLQALKVSFLFLIPLELFSIGPLLVNLNTLVRRTGSLHA